MAWVVSIGRAWQHKQRRSNVVEISPHVPELAARESMEYLAQLVYYGPVGWIRCRQLAGVMASSNTDWQVRIVCSIKPCVCGWTGCSQKPGTHGENNTSLLLHYLTRCRSYLYITNWMSVASQLSHRCIAGCFRGRCCDRCLWIVLCVREWNDFWIAISLAHGINGENYTWVVGNHVRSCCVLSSSHCLPFLSLCSHGRFLCPLTLSNLKC